MAGPRNNYSRLPWEIRRLILQMLHDGADYNEIRSDLSVSRACAERHLTLHNATFLAVRRSQECRDYIARAERNADTRDAERIAAAVIGQTGAMENITDVARYELSKQVKSIISDLAAEGDPQEKAKLLRSVTQSLAALSNPELNRKLAAKDDEINRLKSEIEKYKQQIIRHNTLVDELKNNAKSSGGISVETLQQIEEKIGLL